MKRMNQECKELYAVLRTGEGEEIQLMNDGQMTTLFAPDGCRADKRILQTRSAFRGFVMALTELMGYELHDTKTDAACGEAEEGGEE